MNVMRARKLALLCLACLAAVGNAQADPKTREERVKKFASLPDWTGIWEAQAWTERTAAGRPAGGIEEVRSKAVLMGHPPYNAEWEARYQAGLKNVAAIAASEAKRKVCSFGFPMGMESPSLFQISITPEEALFVFVTQDVRHVYTDGRPHAPQDELWPTRMGDSIGRWEGDTLVIDTVALNDKTRIDEEGITHSDQLHVVERIRKIDGGKQLESLITITDPVMFTKPWTTKRLYKARPDVRVMEYVCEENNRNAPENGVTKAK